MLFLKHNIWNDFDDLTDVARMYKAKAVPSFIFLTGGAMVSSFLCLPNFAGCCFATLPGVSDIFVQVIGHQVCRCSFCDRGCIAIVSAVANLCGCRCQVPSQCTPWCFWWYQSFSCMQVRHLRLPDTRSMYGSTTVLNRVYGYERKRLNATLREMLFRNAPSARR